MRATIIATIKTIKRTRPTANFHSVIFNRKIYAIKMCLCAVVDKIDNAIILNYDGLTTAVLLDATHRSVVCDMRSATFVTSDINVARDVSVIIDIFISAIAITRACGIQTHLICRLNASVVIKICDIVARAVDCDGITARSRFNRAVIFKTLDLG